MKKKNDLSSPNQQPIQPWRLLDKKNVFKSKWLEVNKEKVSLSNGKVIEDFYTLSGEKLVCIVAVTRDYKIVLVKQYRHGAKKVLWDIPGGGVNKKEIFIEAAKRELAEETGYESPKWIALGQFYPDPARSSTIKKIFLALDAFLSPKLKREEIFTELVALEQIKLMIKEHQIKELGANLAIILALQRLKGRK